jgi:ABC-type multidrug transport system fused ATPase/permease subunit
MISYLAAGNGVSGSALGGFLGSLAVTVFGFLTLQNVKSIAWRRQGRELVRLEKTISERERNAAPLTSDADPYTIHEESFWREREEYSESSIRLRERVLLNETESLFRRAKAAFAAFLIVAIGTSAVLLYGSYLALEGHIASGIVVALSGAIPATFSLGLYRLQSSADKRASEALKTLDQEVEKETLIKRIQLSARRVADTDSRERLEMLASLRAAMPDATPEQLALLLGAVSGAPMSEKGRSDLPPGRRQPQPPQLQ